MPQQAQRLLTKQIRRTRREGQWCELCTDRLVTVCCGQAQEEAQRFQVKLQMVHQVLGALEDEGQRSTVSACLRYTAALEHPPIAHDAS